MVIVGSSYSRVLGLFVRSTETSCEQWTGTLQDVHTREKPRQKRQRRIDKQILYKIDFIGYLLRGSIGWREILYMCENALGLLDACSCYDG